MKRSIAISLIIFLLIGQTGLTFATHYCGGQEVKTGLVIGNTLPGCGMEMMQACGMNTSEEGPLVKREPCCENHIRTIEANEDLLSSILHSTVSLSLVMPLVIEPAYINAGPEIKTKLFANHSPPTAEHDFQISFQTFLI